MADRARSLDGYAAVLRAAVHTLGDSEVPHVVFGSIATRALARPRPIDADEDIDVLVRPSDLGRATEALVEAGFVTEEADPSWLHKAKRSGITVDVIFRAGGDVHLDEEMIDRAVRARAFGVDVALMPPEDLAVIKAVLHNEHRAFDWFDALAILHREDLDWDYLTRRARQHGAHRVLALMLYGRATGIPVPGSAIAELVAAVEA